MILQRYTFGSKSQHDCRWRFARVCCLWYCKDIHLEANHNCLVHLYAVLAVAYDIAKIYIWKQITTQEKQIQMWFLLLMILQRYTFGSKSQHMTGNFQPQLCCLWYCKDIHLEANHNIATNNNMSDDVAYDIAKIYIWKQITTACKTRNIRACCLWYCKDIHLEANHNFEHRTLTSEKLLMILQRYTFGSKSQQTDKAQNEKIVAYDIAKIYIWKQITTHDWKLPASIMLLMILQRYTFGSKSQHCNK